MSTLCEELEALLHQCEDGAGEDDRKFMPFQLLQRVLTPERIGAEVDSIGDIEFFLKTSVTTWIQSHGRRIFAILTLLREGHFITKFMGQAFQGTRFDEKLPFSKEELEAFIPDIAPQFYQRQWEFVSPVWSKNVVHREVPPDVRLPFIYNKRIDRGGFGVVYEIKLHPDHQRTALFPGNKNQRIVRKEFKSIALSRAPTFDSAGSQPESQPGSRSDSMATSENIYAKELRNLSILNELKHPNIIELVTSYTYRGKHNLVFPLMEGGDLGGLLRGTRPELFHRNETFLVALCELSSAIEKVHHYTLDKFDIELMGCHYDLKPKNILIQGSTFVLADFGISRLSSESDQELYSGGGSDYLAPECTDADNEFERKAIDRSSDVWSFGCIISEILTYMKMGPAGVKDFRAKREVQIGSRIISAFHQGYQKDNKAFRDWLCLLEGEPDTFSRNIVHLIRKMTALDRSARPSAKEVTLSLQKSSVQAYYLSVRDLYNLLAEKAGDSFEAYAEYTKIQSWGSVLKLTQENGDDAVASGLTDEMDLVKMYTCLAKIQEELEVTIERFEDSLSPLFSSLRSLGEELYDLLPSELGVIAKRYWEIEMVRSEDLGDLLKTAEGAEVVSNRIATLARIKRMSILVATNDAVPLNPTDTCLKIDHSSLRQRAPFGSHTHAELRTQDGSEKKVLVERVQYHRYETRVLGNLLARIESLSALLNSADKPTDFRILRCSGYIHNPSDCAFSLVFDLPERTRSVPKSLDTVITETYKSRERPTLGSRFNLALTLALSLSGFHKVGWLHKSISAYNVLLLIPSDSAAAKNKNTSGWLEDPYLIGFNRSRQDDTLVFTSGHTETEKVAQYYHPSYTPNPGSQRPYRLHYDYYSLGLVLLQIGLWEGLSKLVKVDGQKALSTREMLDHLLKKRVPMLGHYMGVDYQAAVWACLTEFEELGDTTLQQQDNTAHQLRFEERVINRLRKCRA
ncbi:hypothetical protein TWF281_001651 [Arthrobotrys megalospora]